ncbi:hypothetical protein BC941DRAFT_470547 [Chlamydoabsidia padenii]|nr:hypothetical protein BC941DRAFT_470547 [Chlamydoabsidia padenii]
MTSYSTRHFTSAHYTAHHTTWTRPQSLNGRETLVESSYDFYDTIITTQSVDHTSTSSLSSMTCMFPNTMEAETDVTNSIQQPQIESTKHQRSLHVPLFENTSDWDTPVTKQIPVLTPAPRPCHWPGGIRLMMKIILWFSLISWVYKVYSCVDLKQMPTERLYAVDPGAPINVWIPVFQWTCWKQGWFGNYPTSTLWIIGTTIGLYWLHWKRH